MTVLSDVTGEAPPPRQAPVLSRLGYSDVAGVLQEGVLVVDRSGRVLDVTDRFLELFDVDAAGLGSVRLDGAYADVTEPVAPPETEPGYSFPRALAEGPALHGVVLAVALPDGGRRWVRLNVAPAGRDGLEDVVVVTALDVSAEHDGLLALAEAEHRYLLAARHAPIGIAIVSTEGVFLDSNEMLCRLLGYRHEELVGMTFHEITHPEDLAVDVAHVEELLAGRADTYRIQKRYFTREGRVLWVQLTVAMARNERGQPQYFISMVEDVSAEREAHTALAHRATHDALTGLPNRTLLLDRTQQAIAQAARDGRPLALLFCDLDQFKLINDSRGHDAGDAVLVETAERLSANIRAGDTVARLGGDEFVVLCHALGSRAEAERVAQRLIDTLTEPMLRAHGLTMTVSIGIAFAEPGVTATELLRNADAAMYRAKSAGRDRYSLFSPELITQATERLDLEHELRDAIRTQALYLDYQPVRRLQDGTVTAYESLVRWQHPQRGPLSPGAFLPIAESSDLVLEVDRWVLSQACADAARWGDGPETPSLTVNISARHIGRGLLPGFVARSLSASGLRPQRLILEITETALLGLTPTAQSELDTLVHLGVRLAIDDFGTGYSSLAHLVEVPASYVKIDRSFVSEMTRSSGRRAIVSAVLSLCSALDVEVVAEGIEEVAQRSLLVSLGCRYGQGYLLGRPAPLPAAIA